MSCFCADIEARDGSSSSVAVDADADRVVAQGLRREPPVLRAAIVLLRLLPLFEALARFVLNAQCIMPTVSMNLEPRVARAAPEFDDSTAFAHETLASVVRELGVRAVEPAVLARLIDIVLRSCECVARSHARGAIHGALTPSCVLLGRDGLVSVCPSRLSAEPASIAYYATEQAWGRSADLDARTDVYAFGGMIFSILTLRAPHEHYGDARLELASARSGTVRPPQTLCPERQLPRELCRIATRALAASPADRYPSIALLQRDLERFLRSADFAVPFGAQMPVHPEIETLHAVC